MKRIIILAVLLVLCLGVGGYSLYKIHTEQTEVSRAEELAAEYAPYSPSDYFNSGSTYSRIYEDFSPKLSELKAINADVVGWLYIPSTNIDYPVLQGSDNSYYLTHTPKGQYSPAGSVFVDERGFSDTNTIIYGHNMGRSSNIMFHDITNFADINWFNKVNTGYIITEDGITELNIFAYSLTKPQTEFYYDDVSLDYIKNNALNYRQPAQGTAMVTLSTCAYDYKDARAVLSCMANKAWEK
jgi:sortase B